MFDWVGDHYHGLIDAPGKAGLFWILTGLIVTFVVVRLVTRLNRIRPRWWPFRDVEVGGVHVHHLVPGVLLMVASGALTIALLPPSPWAEVFAAAFGAGAALVLDEYALLLHLDDVYWSEEGRRSIDAVILSVALLCLMLHGIAPIGVGKEIGSTQTVVRNLASAYVVVHLVVTAITLLKGKIATGVGAFFLPVLATVGACRLARPQSPWARWFYRGQKMARSVERFGPQSLSGRVREFVYDAIGGTPTRAVDQPPVVRG